VFLLVFHQRQQLPPLRFNTLALFLLPGDGLFASARSSTLGRATAAIPAARQALQRHMASSKLLTFWRSSASILITSI
jgi:hypothetical protein